VGFLMKSLKPGTTLEAATIEAWIAAEALGLKDQQDVPDSVDTPSVSVAICTKDHPDLLTRCLEGLEALDAGNIPLEILIIDNASRGQETRVIAEGRARTRYIREDRAGLNFARNRALEEAGHDIIAFIDDDVVVDPLWLQGLVTAWRRAPNAGAFTGQVFPYELETRAQIVIEEMGGFRKGFRPIIYGQESEDPLYPCTTVFGNGCNMAFRTDCMRALGGFDEALDMGAYLPGGGDLDALYRVVRHGHGLVYEPRMLVRHQHRREMRALRRQIRRSWGAGTMAFLCKIRAQDTEMADKAQTFIQWWRRDLIRRVLRGHNERSAPWWLSVQELAGAMDGLNGLYSRASRRAAAIRDAAHV
jgi:glycosyltransferase involved in cell wall biosynthesis